MVRIMLTLILIMSAAEVVKVETKIQKINLTSPLRKHLIVIKVVFVK